jgi:hypothetical protein
VPVLLLWGNVWTEEILSDWGTKSMFVESCWPLITVNVCWVLLTLDYSQCLLSPADPWLKKWPRGLLGHVVSMLRVQSFRDYINWDYSWVDHIVSVYCVLHCCKQTLKPRTIAQMFLGIH